MTSDKRYKGPVKRVTIKETYDGYTEKTYRLYDRSGKLIEYASEDGKYILEYNSKNQCIRETCYMGSSVAGIWETEYDIFGNAIQITYVVDGELLSKNQFKYDQKGRKIQQVSFNYNTQTYDELGNLVTGTKEVFNFEYDSHGNQIKQFGTRGTYRTIIQYNNDGTIAQEKEFDEDELESVTSYYYDNNGRLVAEVKHQCGGLFTTEYSYDFQDNCILETYTDRDNSGFYTRRIFDFNGNCTGQRTYRKGETEHYREVLSQIEYFE